MRKGTVIELSHRMIPGSQKYRLETRTFDVSEFLPEIKHRPEIWYVMSEITMSSHEGTHIEFPYHHKKDGLDGANFPIENLIGSAVVLDFSNKKNGEAITLEEVKVQSGRIRKGDMIFIRSDMDKLFFTNRWEEFPYLTPQALDYLISFNPPVLGADAIGFEILGTDYQPHHTKMFENHIAMVESLTNLAAIGDERVMVFILPLAIEGIDACPVRVVAFRRKDLNYTFQSRLSDSQRGYRSS